MITKIVTFGIMISISFFSNLYAGGGGDNPIRFVDLLSCKGEHDADKIKELNLFERYDSATLLEEGIHVAYKAGAQLSAYGTSDRRIFNKDKDRNVLGLTQENFDGVLDLGANTFMRVASKITDFKIEKSEDGKLFLRGNLQNFGGWIFLSCEKGK